jgi:dsRNA-specific ribonuclease
MSKLDEDLPITYGIRDERFKTFLYSLLKKGKIKDKYINFLLEDKESIDLYAKAFTNPTANPEYNYEILEKIGDSTCNKIIMWYIYRKYPKLESKPQGLMVFSRLFHVLQSTETFCKLALELGFEKFITAGWMRLKDKYEEVLKINRNGVLEDCFEAFFGATELIIDRKIKEGVGYTICNEIFKGILRETNVQFPSIKYEELFDPITRLKELFDFNFEGFGKLGKYVYEDIIQENDTKIKVVQIIYTNQTGIKKIIGTGSGSLKEKAKASAAISALEHFKKLGFQKKAPYDYKDFI